MLEIVFLEKKDQTQVDDSSYITSAILNRDHILDLLEQYTMYNCKPIIYQASLATAQPLLQLYNISEKGQYLTMQKKILNTTILLIWHIQLMFSSVSTRQQRLSGSVAALLVVGNSECCDLMARIFPKPLLRRVDSEHKLTEWKPEKWKDFFVLLQNNYNTVAEQWNDECRTELIVKLKEAALTYIKAKFDPKNFEEAKERPYWNHGDFSLNYSTLEAKCLVGKYYLKDLIIRNEGSRPYLKETIKVPVAFWNVFSL